MGTINRVRLKGDMDLVRNVDHLVKVYFKTGAYSWTWSASGNVPPESFEYFSDVTGSPNDRLAFKDCYHEIYRMEPNVTVYSYHDQVGERYDSHNCFTSMVLFNQWQAHWWRGFNVGPSEEELDAFNKRAYQGMKPEVEMQMDMPTFLTELSSLPDLFKSDTLLRMFMTKKGRKKVPQWNPVTTLSGDYLNWQFGWSPTIADAQALYDVFQNLVKKIDRLLAQQGEVFVSHYSEKIVLPEAELEERLDGTYTYCRATLPKRKFRLTATMRYTYSIELLTEARGKAIYFLGALDALGFNNPLRTLWERIPFSFVLDWFIPVGDWLEQFGTKWIDSTVNVLDYCISYRSTSEIKVEYRFVDTAWGRNFEMCRMFYDKLYCRRRALPDDDKFGLRVDSRYGTKQICLSGALAASIFGGKQK